MSIDNILKSPALASMRARHQWVVWTLVPDSQRPSKPKKMPLNPRTGAAASSTDPTTWSDVSTAAASARQGGPGFGVGYVFAGDHWFVDVDSCLQSDGQWSPLAQHLCASLAGAAVEVSQSGQGLHLFGQGMPPAHSNKNAEHRAELYTTGRFVALTGNHLAGFSEGDFTQGIAAVAARYFPPRETSGFALADGGPRPEWRGPADDGELLRRAMASRSAASKFGGGGAAFADLFDANVEVLSKAFPPDASSDEPFDRSSADAALFQHLAFWVGCESARMLRIAECSALKRDKWEREDYLERTITNACRMQRDVLQDKPPPESPLGPPAVAGALGGGDVAPIAPVAPTATMTARDAQTFLGAEAQAAMFAGCVYVVDHHKVMCPGGRLLSPEKFRAVFGGYSFPMDNKNERVSRNAFEAFTESQVLKAPIVDGTCFKPGLPYGAIIESEGRKRANIWWPANVARKVGDISPFLEHLRKVLPHPDDQRVLLYYMAGCVQFVGTKFQWFPLVIGVEGNGKSLFSRCVAAAVGQRYTHWPAANKLGKQFNAWLFGKVFFPIEDLKIGDSIETWEMLKPMITGESIEVEAKGVDQRTDEISGNFMANSNHKLAVRATANDRRCAQLYCAQQDVSDLRRDGMDGDYMPRLYDWLKADGYALVAEYLHTVTIPPEFGKGWLLGRAPRTTSSIEAIESGRGRIEQEVLEAVEQGEVGFRDGWISSIFLDRLLDRLGRGGAVALNARRDMLRALGYDWHPALPNGRVHNVVMPDGAKPRLFIRSDHPARLLTVGGEAAKAYSQAQGVGASH